MFVFVFYFGFVVEEVVLCIFGEVFVYYCYVGKCNGGYYEVIFKYKLFVYRQSVGIFWEGKE